MATKIIQNLPAVVGAQANGIATIDLPTGPRYFTGWLKIVTSSTFDPATDKLDATIGLIRVKLNGRVQRQITSVQLNAIQSFYGQAFGAWIASNSAPNVITGRCRSDGLFVKLDGTTFTSSAGTYVIYMPVYFADVWRKQFNAVEFSAWPTVFPGINLIGSFQIEVSCGAKLASMTAFAEIDYNMGQVTQDGTPILLLTKYNTNDFPLASGTNQDFSTNTLPRGEIYQGLSAFLSGTNADISAVQVKTDGIVIRDVTRGLNNVSAFGRENNWFDGQVANQLHVVFDFDDIPSSGLNTGNVRDFQVKYTLSVSSSGTLSIVTITTGGIS